MAKKSLLGKLFYIARDLRSSAMFKAMRKYCHGAVLDVGGWDFYLSAIRKGIPFGSWTVIEPGEQKPLPGKDDRVRLVVGDGCNMEFASGSFDTILNIQVLEHVFEPIAMVDEMCRVLKPGGHLIMLVPQTSTLHMAPNHYYNFTRYWIQKALERNELQILDLAPLGGVWSTTASRLVYFFFQSMRSPGMSPRECTRNPWFYILYPFMVVFAVVAIAMCMLFSLGDLTEEPNNHLVVARKRGEPSVA